jgi:hypothetical protein
MNSGKVSGTALWMASRRTCWNVRFESGNTGKGKRAPPALA